MKIKMIDLLSKIANNEEVPKKIKYKNEIYERYQNITTNNLYYYQVPNKCKFLIDQLSSAIDLLDEVEIIEEPKKIEYEQIEELSCNEYDFEKKTINSLIKNQRKLIDEVNKLKEGK